MPAPPKPGFWRRIKYPLRWLLIAGAIYTLIHLFKQYDLAGYLNQQELRALIEPLGQAAPLAFIGLFVVAMLLMVIPYALLAGLSTVLFGPAWGLLWTVLGGTTAAVAVWGLSRLIGQRVLASKQDDPRWKNLNERLRSDGFYYLLLVRALSIVPFNILNFACACTAIRFRDFLLANLIGLIPSAFVYGYGTQILLDPKAPKTVLYAFVGVVTLLLVTPLVFRQARRQQRAEQRQAIVQSFENPGR